MSTFEAILNINGFPIGKARKQIENLRCKSFSNLLEYQKEERWNILREHFNHNPFYKSICKNILPKDWSEVPVIKKRDLQKPILEMLNPHIKKKDLFIGKTSGSTGTPMVFAKDKFCHSLTWAQILSKYSSIGVKEDDLQARFYGMPVSGFYFYKERIKDLLSNRIRFAVNDLSENILEKYVQLFKRKSIVYIYGYTNSIKIFAEFLIKNKIQLKDICPSLKCCIITSEVCTPYDEALLKQALSIPIYNEYGASELGVIAFPEKERLWRISDEDLFVEILNENGEQVQRGEKGRVVVTALHNKAMPFIRYELGDIASLNEDFENGNFLSSLQGRLTDTLRLPSGRIVPGATLYIASKFIYDKIPELKEFIIKQTALNTIEYDLVVNGSIDESVKKDVVNLTYKYLEPGINVKINVVNQIKRTASGKFKFFQSFIGS